MRQEAVLFAGLGDLQNSLFLGNDLLPEARVKSKIHGNWQRLSAPAVKGFS